MANLLLDPVSGFKTNVAGAVNAASEFGSDRFKGVCDKNGCDIQHTCFMGKGQTFYGPGSKYKIDTTKPVTDMIVKVTLMQKSRCHEECCTNHELERIVAVDKDCL